MIINIIWGPATGRSFQKHCGYSLFFGDHSGCWLVDPPIIKIINKTDHNHIVGTETIVSGGGGGCWWFVVQHENRLINWDWPDWYLDLVHGSIDRSTVELRPKKYSVHHSALSADQIDCNCRFFTTTNGGHIRSSSCCLLSPPPPRRWSTDSNCHVLI